jgi:glycosyltransferase involved in cell wall biosynthesis
MNISICITVFNEEGAIIPLLDSLLNQSKKPDQIIIVDGGSTDKTVEIIRHYQQKDGKIKLFVEKCSRAEGRNLSVEIAKNDIIAMTDAGCIADRDWLKNITEPFKIKEVDVSAGFYTMTGKSNLQKAESVFLGVTPRNFNINFLPSTRSIAFRKSVWENVGGFPESLEGAAEDTVFNYKLINSGAKISRIKDAIVEWGMPVTISNFQFTIFNYAKGDAKSKIWNFPGKGLTSHNIKALSIFARYIFLVGLLIFSFVFHLSFIYSLIIICPIFIFAYLIWSFRKVFIEFNNWRIAIWGPILQITSDIGVMSGFISGIIH